MCQKCSRIAALFHRLHHQKHRMFSECSDVVEGRRKANPALDTTKILNELLANDKWLEQVNWRQHTYCSQSAAGRHEMKKNFSRFLDDATRMVLMRVLK